MTTFELVPHIKVDQADYTQPAETALDVSPFSDVVLQLSVLQATTSNGFDIWLATAMENDDQQYLRVMKLHSFTGSQSDFKKTIYCSGEGTANSRTDGESSTPFGLGRYIRIETENMGEGDYLFFDVKVLARGHSAVEQVEFVPHTQIDDYYDQPIDTAFDASAYNELAVLLNVHKISGIGAGQVAQFFLATAVENRDDRYVRVARLARLDEYDEDAEPFKQFTCIVGPGEIDSDEGDTVEDYLLRPSFGRYLRVEVDNVPGATFAFDVKAIARGAG